MFEHSLSPSPSVHMNGDTLDELIKQYNDVCESSLILMNSMKKNSPHARNFYIQGEEAYPAYRKAYEERYIAVNEIYKENLAILLDLIGKKS